MQSLRKCLSVANVVVKTARHLQGCRVYNQTENTKHFKSVLFAKSKRYSSDLSDYYISYILLIPFQLSKMSRDTKTVKKLPEIKVSPTGGFPNVPIITMYIVVISFRVNFSNIYSQYGECVYYASLVYPYFPYN